MLWKVFIVDMLFKMLWWCDDVVFDDVYVDVCVMECEIEM